MAWSYSDLERAALEVWQEDFDARPRRRELHVALASSDLASIWSTTLPSTPAGIITFVSLLSSMTAPARRLLLPDVEMENASALGDRALRLLTRESRRSPRDTKSKKGTDFDITHLDLLRQFAWTTSELAQVRLGSRQGTPAETSLRSVQDQARDLTEELDRFVPSNGNFRFVSTLTNLNYALDEVLNDPLWYGPIGTFKIDRIVTGSVIGEVSGASAELASAISTVASIPQEHRRSEDDAYHAKFMQTLERYEATYRLRDALGAAAEPILDRLREELVGMADQRLSIDAQERVATRMAAPTADLGVVRARVQRADGSPNAPIPARPLPREVLPSPS